MPSPRVVPADCSLRYPVFSDLIVIAPGCDPLLQGLARLETARHQERLTRLLDGPFALAPLLRWVDDTEEQLTPYVLGDDRGPGFPLFQREVEVLRRELRLLHVRLAAEQRGETVELNRLDVQKLNDFEAATPAGVQLGVLGVSLPATEYEVAVREGQELGGVRHLQLSFDLRDGSAPREQWVRFTVPFNSADPYNLNTMQELRLRLQSSAPRKFRISFTSSGYSEYGSVTTFGWTVETTGAPQLLTLPIPTAALPEGVTLPETREFVLTYAYGILIGPVVEGLGEDGYLGPGSTDSGWLRVDDIEFVPAPASATPEAATPAAPEPQTPEEPETGTPEELGTPGELGTPAPLQRR